MARTYMWFDLSWGVYIIDTAITHLSECPLRGWKIGFFPRLSYIWVLQGSCGVLLYNERCGVSCLVCERWNFNDNVAELWGLLYQMSTVEMWPQMLTVTQTNKLIKAYLFLFLLTGIAALCVCHLAAFLTSGAEFPDDQDVKGHDGYFRYHGVECDVDIGPYLQELCIVNIVSCASEKTWHCGHCLKVVTTKYNEKCECQHDGYSRVLDRADIVGLQWEVNRYKSFRSHTNDQPSWHLVGQRLQEVQRSTEPDGYEAGGSCDFHVHKRAPNGKSVKDSQSGHVYTWGRVSHCRTGEDYQGDQIAQCANDERQEWEHIH